MARDKTGVPDAQTFAWPTLFAVRSLGGSATNDDIAEAVSSQLAFTEAQQAVTHGSSGMTEITYRLAWARTYLKNIGALENSARGIWSVTELGQTLDQESTERLLRRWRAAYAAKSKGQRAEPTPPEEVTWPTEVLGHLLRLSPGGFERLARRLLLEAGFSNVNVTGRSGDGGIDGVGVYRVSLISFPVFFQCKRYKGSVRAAQVRDFRGAMAGRGDKGLLITTGSFTADAQREATREGATPVDLIDGTRLADLLKEFGLGVQTTTQAVEHVRVDADFFEEKNSETW